MGKRLSLFLLAWWLLIPSAGAIALVFKVPTDFRIPPRMVVPPAKAVKETTGIAYGKHVDITLSDGTVVRCYPAATVDPRAVAKSWYYLPTSPRIARDNRGLPQFSLIKFVTDKSKDQGGAEGAVLHFLVEYGLTPEQKKELERRLKQRIKGAELKGAVPLENTAEGNSFRVISAIFEDKEFTSHLISSGKAPVMEGQKVAVAARLSAYGATLLEKSLELPTSQISVEFELRYITKLPAYKAWVTIDYDRYNQIRQDLQYKREKIVRKYWDPKWYNLFNKGSRTYINESEKQHFIDFLKSTGVVSFYIDANVPEADKEIVEMGLQKVVLEEFFNMQKTMAESLGEETEFKPMELSKEQKRAARGARSYRAYLLQAREIKRHGRVTIDLRRTIARYESHIMVGNVGAWYKKFKNDPRLVAEVNLDDPFFQRGEIRFVIDNEAYDIFKQMVNYATVMVRVPRRGAAPFEDEITIDRKYLEEHGQTAVLTFAKMGKMPRRGAIFQYAVQWSLRGGYLYPPQPRWQPGDIMAVTLAAPVRPRVIEAEADIDELSSLNVARVVVELRYQRFGRPFVDHSALKISVAKGEPLSQKVIYHDRNQDRVEYRTVFYHKKLGRITGPWQEVQGDYIFCSPPASLLEKIKAGL